MNEHAATQLTLILVLGIGAQWVAWRIKIPAILMLLFAGFAVGPGQQWFGRPKLLDPDLLLGSLLLPLVSMSVAVVLFEGGLSLNFAELRGGGVIRNLVTLGAAATWLVATVAAHWILGMAWPLAILMGAILIVTGPTVIGRCCATSVRSVKPGRFSNGKGSSSIRSGRWRRC